MWVRLSEWMMVDGDVPEPSVGLRLNALGVRLSAVTHHAPNEAPDAFEEVGADLLAQVRYRVTGTVERAQDFRSDEGFGQQHAGCELVLKVEGQRLLVTTDGFASDFPTLSRATSMGRLSVVGPYEWEDFQLPDTRTDWLVRAVEDAGSGDVMIDLREISEGDW